MDHVSVAVLAGGDSRRMGQNKARLIVAGVPLIERVASVVSTFGPLTVVGGSADLLDLITVDDRTHQNDLYPGEGPLGGLLSALEANTSPWTLVAACDLANLDVGAVGDLVAHGKRNNADVAVPLIGGHRQWHIALWNRRALHSLEKSYLRGVRSLRAAASGLRQTALVPALSSSYIDLDNTDDVIDFENTKTRN